MEIKFSTPTVSKQYVIPTFGKFFKNSSRFDVFDVQGVSNINMPYCQNNFAHLKCHLFWILEIFAKYAQAKYFREEKKYFEDYVFIAMAW